MMNKYNDIFVLGILFMVTQFFGTGCEKNMSITEFSDDWESYQSEFRIEAVLDAVDPWNSIVRIDRTILVSDTSIFNGRDDDGDWVGFTDENGNGKWDEGEPLNDDQGEDGISSAPGDFEIQPDKGQGDGKPTPGEPHIDELDEILPRIHDSTSTVVMIDKSTGEVVADFIWEAQADSFQTMNGFHDQDSIEMVIYGAYKLSAIYSTIRYYKEYEFQINTSGQVLITGSTTPLPPVEFDNIGQQMSSDTVLTTNNPKNLLKWNAAPEAVVYWVIVEQVDNPDSIVTITSKPWQAFSQDSEGRQQSFDFLSQYPVGLYRWQVVVPSSEYGAYIYAQLPLRDEQLSNLRDENSEVVLGIAGAVSGAEQYVRIIPD